MRTTLTIDDHLARALKERAHRSGKPFKQIVNETLRAGLATYYGTSAKAERELGWRARPLDEGLRDTVAASR